MKHFSKEDISKMSSIYRLNMINSCTGYKSANLIATKSEKGLINLAVFNSVIHLGSNPPIIGFILRPTTVPRHTFQNLKETGVFTVNHIHYSQIEDAHHTSAKYPQEVSEFDETNLEEEFKNGISAPFVKESPLQLACSYLNEYHIKENDTLMIVGQIEHIFMKDEMLENDGWIDLEKGGVVSINGLEGYALPKLLERFPYARPKVKNE
ncbi:MAG: flavin reductase family protein [Flavobacteriaceae bacterium]|nr:flavin reductase family protein [Flavobacteriaceae bacterium]